jgi:hypothetical protein
MSVKNYTLADYRTEVQTRLREPATGGLWSVSEINNYVNRAIVRVGIDVRLPKKDAPIPLVAGISFYSFPSDYMIPEFIYGSSTLGNQWLFPTTLIQLDRMQDGRGDWEKDNPGTPTHFVPFSQNQFILWPPVLTNDNVNLHYTPFLPALVNDSDTTQLPLTVQRLVPLFASYLAQMKNDPKKAVGLHLAEYKRRAPMAVVQQRQNEKLRPKIMAPGRAFDRKNANPEVRRDWTRWGYR